MKWVSKSCSVLTSQILHDSELWYLDYTKLSIYNNFRCCLALNYISFSYSARRQVLTPLGDGPLVSPSNSLRSFSSRLGRAGLDGLLCG